MKGIHGRYLDVDLSSGSTAPYEIPGDWYRRYLGGRGIGVRLLLEEMSGREDPLGPQNILVFVTGPLQGSLLGGAGRHGVISMSPKTNSLSDTYAGGYFGHELARSGYDGVLIRGRAARPTYLACIDGQVSLEDATDLWGLTTAETEMRLLRRYPGARVTSIGVAGENTVRFACLINDGGRAAARPGFGAVMGSKRLKAVVIKGSTPKPVHAPEALARVRREIVSRLSDDEGKDMRARGTAR
ncbi:MAG: aldehyde ferredoxin oxidoreductase N-terminal domain-containing protein, partial [Candidatus Bipolaricaulota bacterium]